jgi:S1-C subfamily serine protease
MDDNTKRVVLIALLVLAVAFECVLALVCGSLGGYVGAKIALNSAQGAPASSDVEIIPWERGTPRGSIPEVSRSWAALVIAVESDSPADAAGISPGDMIVAVDGIALSEDVTLRELVLERRPGDQITLTISRGTRTWDARVTLGSVPEGPGDAPWLGIRFQMVPRVVGGEQ